MCVICDLSHQNAQFASLLPIFPSKKDIHERHVIPQFFSLKYMSSYLYETYFSKSWCQAGVGAGVGVGLGVGLRVGLFVTPVVGVGTFEGTFVGAYQGGKKEEYIRREGK